MSDDILLTIVTTVRGYQNVISSISTRNISLTRCLDYYSPLSFHYTPSPFSTPQHTNYFPPLPSYYCPPPPPSFFSPPQPFQNVCTYLTGAVTTDSMQGTHHKCTETKLHFTLSPAIQTSLPPPTFPWAFTY